MIETVGEQNTYISWEMRFLGQITTQKDSMMYVF